MNSITYGNGIYVYGGSSGQLATSTDAITWTARTSGTTSTIYTLTYGNGLYVYGGGDGGIYTSTDAISWDIKSFINRPIYGISYNNGQYFITTGTEITGVYLYTSTDLVSLRIKTTASTIGGNIQSLAYANDTYVFQTQNNIYSANAYTYNKYTEFALPDLTKNSASILNQTHLSNLHIKATP
jgi:hypothetical protein